jgi:hypothetical protein
VPTVAHKPLQDFLAGPYKQQAGHSLHERSKRDCARSGRQLCAPGVHLNAAASPLRRITMHIARQTAVFGLSVLLIVGAASLSRTEALASRAEEQLSSSPGLTIYNAKFAVVRQKLPLDLKPGTNHVQVTDITAHLEPDSVILRPFDSGRRVQILEQNYRNDPVTQELLLSLYEGKTIEFQQTDKDGKPRIIEGKIIRSGYIPHYNAFSNYGQQYYQAQMAYVQGGSEQPIIEVNGKLQFSLPGQPIFPALADDTVLKPTLSWELQADKPGALATEFSYVTGGMNWAASYNVVAPPKGNVLDLVGWVTLDNQSGKTFQDAHIKLMAGDVNKIQPPGGMQGGYGGGVAGMAEDRMAFGPPVTERTFDEYHLTCTTDSRPTPTIATGPWSPSASRKISGSSPIRKSGSCRSSKTQRTITSACRSPKGACASIAVMTTASSNLPAKMKLTTRLRTKKFASTRATPST